MRMSWRKRGIVFCPDGSSSWAKTHAMIPTPVLISPDCLRVYVTFCDANGIGRPGYVDVSPDDPMHVLRISKEPLLDLGVPGTFDENGVLACSVVRINPRRCILYYVGFELGTRIRYRLLTGAAISGDGGETFSRVSQTPVLERSSSELFFRCGPFAAWQSDRMRMWYVAGSAWTDIDGKAMPVYDVRYIESPDGLHWPAEGRQILPIENPDEHGFGRPWIVERPGKRAQMYLSVRKRSLKAYRLAYAESDDGVHWERQDNLLNLTTSPGSFDSDAIMYSAVITVGARTYCFYNGNEFGRDGFAVAELVAQ
jgi:hypothetical protein